MWTCANCESGNDDSSLICEVCGAALPVVSVSWDNQNGAPGTKAVVHWSGVTIRSAFAVCGKRTFYLTKNERVEIEIGKDIEDVDLYFCSSAGYIKQTYTIGNDIPVISKFVPSATNVAYGKKVRISWDVSRGRCRVDGKDFPTAYLPDSGYKDVVIKDNEEFTLYLVGKTKTINKTIEIKCLYPTAPKFVDLKYKSARPNGQYYIGDMVDIEYRFSGAKHVTFGTERLPESGVISVRLTNKRNSFTLKAYPETYGEYCRVDWTTTKEFVIEAIVPEPKLTLFEHSDLYIEKGGEVSVHWKGENIQNAKVWVSSIDDFLRSPSGREELYSGLDHTIKLRNFTGEDTVKVYFYPKSGGEPIVKELHVVAKRFIGLYKKMHGIEEKEE